MAIARERAADPTHHHATGPGDAMPHDLLVALESGDLTQDQLRRLITHEASQIGLTFDQAVDQARHRELPKTARGSDIELLVGMLAA